MKRENGEADALVGVHSPLRVRRFLSIGLALYHNLGLDSVPNFRWQYSRDLDERGNPAPTGKPMCYLRITIFWMA